MQRLLFLAALPCAVCGVARASSLDDWIRWRMEEDARLVEDQLGLDLGDRAPHDLAALAQPGITPLEPGLRLTSRRVIVPPRIALRLTAHGPPCDEVAVSLVLSWRGFRRATASEVRPGLGSPPAPTLPIRPTGVRALDRALWELAIAERDALTSIENASSRPRRSR